MPESFRAIALLAAYNEEDVISQVIGDLVSQGLEVYLLDHGSTDGTVAAAERHLGRGLLHVEHFPEESGFPAEDATRFAWRSLLARKAQLAGTLDASWFLHSDADELREGPWDGVSLLESIRRVDALGYNAIDFKVLDFVPTRDGFAAGDDLRAFFGHYRPAAWYDRHQINCWKRTDGPLDLSSSGGHEVAFPGRLVFPVRFLLRHYPIRSQAHGERKVFRERRPRFDPDERAAGWHIQYDGVEEGASFIGRIAELVAFDAGRVRTELLVENREVELLAQRAGRLEGDLAPLEEDLAWFRVEWPARERELVELSGALDDLRERLGKVERELQDAAEKLATTVAALHLKEQERASAAEARDRAQRALAITESARVSSEQALESALRALEGVRREADDLRQELEIERRTAAAHASARDLAGAAAQGWERELRIAERALDEAQRYARSLERRIEGILGSVSWRLAAPLREILRRIRGF